MQSRIALVVVMGLLAPLCVAAAEEAAAEDFASVDASFVKGVRYAPDTLTLDVLLVTGTVVTHQGVDPVMYREFMTYSSKDWYYEVMIKDKCPQAEAQTPADEAWQEAQKVRQPPRFAASARALPPDRVRVGLSAWLSQGQAHWQTSFEDFDPEIGSLSARSRLKWTEVEGLLPVLEGTVGVARWLQVGARYGGGNLDDGGVTDSDWVSAPALGIHDFLFSESQSASDGDLRLYDADLRIVVSELLNPRSFPGPTSLFAGYQYYTEDLRIFNGMQTIDLGMPVGVPLPAELNSTYEFRWQAYRAGVASAVPLTETVALSASAALLAVLDYKGEGFWNLRPEWRQTDPNFVHKSDSGTGYDVRIQIAYRPFPNVGLHAGYAWLHLEADSGTATIYFADGSVEQVDLDGVESRRHGLFAGLFVRF